MREEWTGWKNGRRAAVYQSQAAADRAIRSREVDSASPHYGLRNVQVNSEISFRYNGRTYTGQVRSTVDHGPVRISVIVFSKMMGHTHSINDGHVVMPSELIAIL